LRPLSALARHSRGKKGTLLKVFDRQKAEVKRQKERRKRIRIFDLCSPLPRRTALKEILCSQVGWGEVILLLLSGVQFPALDPLPPMTAGAVPRNCQGSQGKGSTN